MLVVIQVSVMKSNRTVVGLSGAKGNAARATTTTVRIQFRGRDTTARIDDEEITPAVLFSGPDRQDPKG